jgi:ABC-type sugar transport system ATPase subunit
MEEENEAAAGEVLGVGGFIPAGRSVGVDALATGAVQADSSTIPQNKAERRSKRLKEIISFVNWPTILVY